MKEFRVFHVQWNKFVLTLINMKGLFVAKSHDKWLVGKQKKVLSIFCGPPGFEQPKMNDCKPNHSVIN